MFVTIERMGLSHPSKPKAMCRKHADSLFYSLALFASCSIKKILLKLKF